MRLQKYMASCGVASRRKSEEMIAAGLVSVNGIVITTPGYDVDEFQDEVVVNGVKLARQAHVYYLLNKPCGVVSTVSDVHAEKTVLDLVPAGMRVHPVGRLDKDTEGLILLTNDGDLTFNLTHPGKVFDKTYRATVKGHVTGEDLHRLRSGVIIDNNGEPYQTAPARVKLLEQKKGSAKLELIIHEGKNRQVRKMCDAVGHPVIRLKRTALGSITAPELAPGEWRELTKEELTALKNS